MKQKVTASAPASAANLFLGFDALGLALDGVYDEVSLSLGGDGLQLQQTAGVAVPLDVAHNSATVALQAMMQDYPLDQGLCVSINKGIPLASGMGGSAASAVAAVVAYQHLLEIDLSAQQLISYALAGEASVSGSSHSDNIVPALLGGLTLSMTPDQFASIPLPAAHAVMVHPHIEVNTAEARAILPELIAFKDYVAQANALAGMITYLYNGDLGSACDLWQSSVVEQVRAPLWPWYPKMKQAALAAGALGVCISGSGPSVLALCDSAAKTKAIAGQMQAACTLSADVFISSLPARGAYIKQEGV